MAMMAWNNIRTMDEALNKFRENYRELGLIIHKQEKQIQFLDTKALHISMFYIASLLLIFLTTNSNPITSVPNQCRKHQWRLLFLSLSIFAMFGLNFATTITKYMRIKFEQDRIFMDQQENYHQMVYLEKLCRNSSGMDIHTIIDADYLRKPHASEDHQRHEVDMFEVYQRYAHVAVTFSVLLAFTVLVLVSSSSCAVPV